MSYSMIINRLVFVLAATILSVVIVLKPHLADAGSNSQHFNLVLTTKLGPTEMVNMECAYMKKPLGVKLVSDKKPLKWDFQVDFSQQSIFSCTAFWQNKYAKPDLFDKNREGKSCAKSSTARWEIRPDGFYFHSDDEKGNIWRRMYQWVE